MVFLCFPGFFQVLWFPPVVQRHAVRLTLTLGHTHIAHILHPMMDRLPSLGEAPGPHLTLIRISI